MEAEHLEQWMLPISQTDVGQLNTRIAAFIEML